VLTLPAGGKRAELDDEVEITGARIEVRAGRRAEDFQAPDVVAPAEFGKSGLCLLKFWDHRGPCQSQSPVCLPPQAD
jgi:hypothetical protein